MKHHITKNANLVSPPARCQRMKRPPGRRLWVALATLMLLGALYQAVGQGTAFTYQGQLQNNGIPASGTYNLSFTLFNTDTSGGPVAGPVTNNTVKSPTACSRC